MKRFYKKIDIVSMYNLKCQRTTFSKVIPVKIPIINANKLKLYDSMIYNLNDLHSLKHLEIHENLTKETSIEKNSKS